MELNMQTPNTRAGELTEHIMCRVRSKLPELPTHEYNRVYEAVLGELQCHVLPEPTDTKGATRCSNSVYTPPDSYKK